MYDDGRTSAEIIETARKGYDHPDFRERLVMMGPCELADKFSTIAAL
jgi:hypothetical protein